MTFPLDKLGLINQALVLCGESQCNTVEDGSPEWTVGSAAYEAAIEYMFEAHNWKFATNFQVLQPSAAPSPDDRFTTAYAKPPDLIHLILVRVNNSEIVGDSIPLPYRIVNNLICCNPAGTPPPAGANFAPGVISIKYVSSTTAAQAASRTFMAALLAFVRAGIYGGLAEETATEQAWIRIAERLIAEARTRSDQEEPRRAMFKSRLRAARRIRRPWLCSSDWSGPGTLG